jgi:hypothetical protein
MFWMILDAGPCGFAVEVGAAAGGANLLDEALLVSGMSLHEATAQQEEPQELTKLLELMKMCQFHQLCRMECEWIYTSLHHLDHFAHGKDIFLRRMQEMREMREMWRRAPESHKRQAYEAFISLHKQVISLQLSVKSSVTQELWANTEAGQQASSTLPKWRNMKKYEEI